jgi:hypothetical protein
MDSITGIPYSINNSINNIGINPSIIIIVIVVIILYFVLFASLGNGESTDSGIFSNSTESVSGSKGLVFIEVLLWGVFILLILLNGMSYIFNINIIASIKHLFSSSPTIDIVVDKEDSSIPEIKTKKQVFHIPDNKYDYESSKAMCQAYGGHLATYNEINDAFNNGADWCGFGWSEGQMALYPTQNETWDKLQGIKGHEHDCGRPGINGGYIDNPNVRFGVNCYGYKPKITPEESRNMMDTPFYPKTNSEIEFDKKVEYWRNKIHDIVVAPFNHTNWSII